MTAPASISHPGFCGERNDLARSRPSDERWSPRKSILFIAAVSALSWLLIASPFVFLG